jgi:hypothetical protein
MIDISKVSDAISSFFGKAGASDLLQYVPVSDLLQNAGINPAMLEGLTADQLLETLTQHGIDPAQLAPEQLTSLLQSLGVQPPGR